MANPTTNFGWVMPTSTDLVTDLPADFNVFGQGVDTSLQYLLGGTTGQVLSKTSNTNMAFTWVAPTTGDITGVTAGTGISGGGTSGDVTITNSMATAIDAKGDLIAGTGADAFSRLAVGSNDQVLVADSTTATGLKWAAFSSGMTKIAAATFSAVSSLDIDSLFSATYKSYLMILTCVGSGAGKVNMRMRYGASTLTSADYYGGGWSIDRNATTASFGQSGTTSRIIIDDINGKCDQSIYFNRVGNTSEEAIWHGTGIQGSQQNTAHYSGLANVSQTYTGVNIATSAGTITGSYSVYGLAI